MRRDEERLLLSFIPRYVRHAVCNPATLLVHFYGAHRVAPLLGRRVSVLPCAVLPLTSYVGLWGALWHFHAGFSIGEDGSTELNAK